VFSACGRWEWNVMDNRILAGNRFVNAAGRGIIRPGDFQSR
jgi:hypothetical protein